MNAVSPFGARIARERAKRGWSLRQLGEKTGISVGGLAKIEHGGGVTLSSAVSLASALSLSLDVLTAPASCPRCDGVPPPGFTCNDCGRGGTP